MRWFWYSVIGLLFGIIMGSVFTVKIPIEWAKYLAVAILAALDTVIGAARAGVEHCFEFAVFASGLFINAILAAGFSFLGEKLGIDLAMVVLIVFGIRIFQNVGIIRYCLMKKKFLFSDDKKS